jgi:hypothetical protein
MFLQCDLKYQPLRSFFSLPTSAKTVDSPIPYAHTHQFASSLCLVVTEGSLVVLCFSL